ncbi:MAG: SMC-Scp complex subunit ScpB [Candidatus Bathyarchaeia archaeon]
MGEKRRVDRLGRLEAALYAAGRPVDMESLKLAVGTKSSNVIMKLIGELSSRYTLRQSALEIKALNEDRAVMRLKEEFNRKVKRFTNRPLLTIGPLKTLSYIAYHQPVEQVRVVADRGSHVYSHLKMMEEMGLIIRERLNGRGYIIETTPYFADYFGFGQDPLKTRIQLRQMFSTLKIPKLENGNDLGGSSDMLESAFADGPLSDSWDGFS